MTLKVKYFIKEQALRHTYIGHRMENIQHENNQLQFHFFYNKTRVCL